LLLLLLLLKLTIQQIQSKAYLLRIVRLPSLVIIIISTTIYQFVTRVSIGILRHIDVVLILATGAIIVLLVVILASIILLPLVLIVLLIRVAWNVHGVNFSLLIRVQIILDRRVIHLLIILILIARRLLPMLILILLLVRAKVLGQIVRIVEQRQRCLGPRRIHVLVMVLGLILLDIIILFVVILVLIQVVGAIAVSGVVAVKTAAIESSVIAIGRG